MKNQIANFCIFFLITFSALVKAEPIKLIFDTDMGNDVDDALALAMLHSLESRGESELLAITLTRTTMRSLLMSMQSIRFMVAVKFLLGSQTVASLQKRAALLA